MLVLVKEGVWVWGCGWVGECGWVRGEGGGGVILVQIRLKELLWSQNIFLLPRVNTHSLWKLVIGGGTKGFHIYNREVH